MFAFEILLEKRMVKSIYFKERFSIQHKNNNSNHWYIYNE